MPKPICMTEAMINETLEDVRAKLHDMKLRDGKHTLDISYYYPPSDPAHPELDHAVVTFTKLAWEKQNRLISEFGDEVGWHGLCHRDPENDQHFIVEDLIVFPQEVTGSTVTPTQEEYQDWNRNLPQEQLRACRYHGHSHVNMPTSPSGTDNKVQEEILGRLDGDGFCGKGKERYLESLGDTYFYIFMIWNKRGEHHARIYDLYTNRYYDEKEVDIEYERDMAMDEFLRDAKQKVKKHTYQTTAPKTAANSPAPPALPNHQKEKEYDHTQYPYGYDDLWSSWNKWSGR